MHGFELWNKELQWNHMLWNYPAKYLRQVWNRNMGGFRLYVNSTLRKFNIEQYEFNLVITSFLKPLKKVFDKVCMALLLLYIA